MPKLSRDSEDKLVYQEKLEKVSMEVITPDEGCMLAVELKMWLAYMQMIEINELRGKQKT